MLRRIILAFPFRCLVFVVIALTMSGCIPFPHFQREAPAIEGEISRDGTLAKNVEVNLAVNQQFQSNCGGAEQRTLTDANGKFRIEETKQFLLFFVYGDRRDSWSLCFKFADGAEAVWSNDGWWGGPPVERLECKFGKELKPSSKPLQIHMQSPKRLGENCTVKEIRSS